MDDKTKVQLRKKLIKNFLAYECESSDESYRWMALIDAVDTVLSFEEDEDGWLL